MTEKKKSCIYDVYLWMGVVGKYTGCFPLPGVYEKREWSKWTKGVINYVIPALNFTYLLYKFVTQLYFSNYFEKPQYLFDFLLLIVNACFFVHFFSCIVFNHLYLRRELVTYLQLHSKVDHLLEPKKRGLKGFVSVLFLLLIGYHTVEGEVKFIIEIGSKEYVQLYYEYPVEMLRSFFICSSESFIYSIAIFTHPYLMYVCFQRVLKSAFDQLLEEIEKHKNDELSGEMRVQKMRKYMRLYGGLCELCTRLDYTLSPLLLITFIEHFCLVICKLALMFNFNEFDFQDCTIVISGFFVFILVSNFAYFTKKSCDKILPAIYFIFNSNEKAVKTELLYFSLQSMYFNQSFSVSGFVKLDRKLLLAIFQSIMSQFVVFYKLVQFRY